jgi:hypothetical protein
MILFFSFNDTNLLPSMLADCCMLLRRDWGLVVAVGRRRPPWSIDARNCIEQKTSPPTPIPPSVPIPSTLIMPPWCLELADAKKRPIRRGGCQGDGSEAGRHGQRVRVRKLIYLAKCTSQQPTTSIDTSWHKYSTIAAMVPQSQRRCIEQLPIMLADCRMRRRLEWGTMAAVGRRRPPWSVGAWFS